MFAWVMDLFGLGGARSWCVEPGKVPKVVVGLGSVVVMRLGILE